MLNRSFGLGMMARPCTELAITQRAHFATKRLPGDADPEFLPQPLAQINQPPAYDTMDSGDRTALDDARQRLPMHLRQSGVGAGRLPVDQPIRSIRVEPQHPVPNDLQPDIADTSRVAPTAAIVDLRKSQQAAGLSRIIRTARQASQIRTSEVASKRDRC